MATAPLRYALIGTGQMGHGHIGALKHVDGVRLVAAADTCEQSRTRCRETVGPDMPIYDNHRELLARERPDAVVIATPNCTHADLVCDALASGCHVLSEKPMSSTLEGCNQVLAAVNANDRTYQVGLELRYAGLWQRTRERIAEGAIGRVRQLWCKEFRGPWALKVDQWITQRDKSGGAIVEKDCHHFDLFNWFVGRPARRVSAFGSCDLVYGAERFEGVTPDVLDNAQVIVEYEDDVVASLMLCMYCTGYGEGLEIGIIGTDGWIIANTRGPGTLKLCRRESKEGSEESFELPEEIRRISHGGAVYFEHLAFRDNIVRHRRPLTGASAAWWSTVVPLAAERAAAEKRVVDIAEFGPAPSMEPSTDA